MNVGDIMTPSPRSLPSGASVREASALLADEHVRHLPVVDDGMVVGVVSDRDLLEATGGEPARAERTLFDLMHAPPTTVRPDDTLVMASVEIGVAKIGCLPVVDDAGGLVGVVTETDLMREFAQATEAGRLDEQGDDPVARFMTADPRTVEPSTTFGAALIRARAHGFRHLPVLEGERLVGIVSDRDLCREIGRGTEPECAVESFMTRDVVTLSPDQSLAQAARVLVDRKISGLPVVDGGKLVGILSSADVVDHCMGALGLDA